ncbi:MAG: hypothetical protein IT250_05875 [Chitinophagaceae bacterium]|nr:hypothetical protein [Chitinophagaceae bacterium]
MVLHIPQRRQLTRTATCRQTLRRKKDQGDNLGNGLQLVTPIEVDKDRWQPYFRLLLETPGREPARRVIWEIANWMFPQDKHFVREFQLSQFDQRIWEIYLWAAFREMKYDILQNEAPDFECLSPMIGIDFTVEATTVAPSVQGVLAEHPNPKTSEEYEGFLKAYMPMKFGSALTSKLNKRNAQGLAYWQHEHSKEKPFILAIADFHKGAVDNDHPFGSMTYTQGGLYIYLYGAKINWEFVDGKLIVLLAKIDELTYKSKSIPPGFFELPESENVSGVLFSNAGTIAKFDRMGVIAGLGASHHKYYRTGFKFDPDPNALVGIPSSVDVEDKIYEEKWCDELQFFHNPKAKYPMPPEWAN